MLIRFSDFSTNDRMLYMFIWQKEFFVLSSHLVLNTH